jgi:cytochrome P450
VCGFSPQYNRVVLGDAELFNNLDATSSPVRIQDGSSLSRLYAGLTNMNGPRRRHHRKAMGSALHRRHVEAYVIDIVDTFDQQMAGWKIGDQIDILAEMRKLTMSVAVRTLLGVDPRREGRDAGRLMQEWMSAVFSLLTLTAPVDLPGLPYHRLQKRSQRLECAIHDLINSRRSAIAQRSIPTYCD